MKADSQLADDPRLHRLISIITANGGFKRGQFVLASGKKSSFYFNTKTATLNPEGVSLIAEVIYDRVKDLGIASIGGLELGSIPIATAVAQLSFRKNNPIPAFWVRDVPKDHGDRTKFEGTLRLGSKVVVVDDVATSGRSILKAITEVEGQGCRIEKVIVLLDREEGARDNLRAYDYESLLRASDFK